MLGGEVEECHEFGPVFLQAQRRLVIFGFVDFDEQIECLFRIVFGLGLSRCLTGYCASDVPRRRYCGSLPLPLAVTAWANS
jgi:hypothetical protein